MINRLARQLLLGLYLAVGVMPAAMPHAENCSHAECSRVEKSHDAHDHSPHDSGWEASADGECAACKVLGLLYTAAPLATEPALDSRVDTLCLVTPALVSEGSRSLHDARGPPGG